MHKYSKFSTLSLLLLLFVCSQDANAQELLPFDVSIPRDDHQLRGHLFEAQGEGPFPIAILLQGIPGGERDVLGLGYRLSEEGIHALTFNYSGTHRSDGEWSMANDLADVEAAYELIRQPAFAERYRIDTARVYLGGYSHGGGVALLYAAEHPEIEYVFSVAGNEFGAWAQRTIQDSAFAQAIEGIFADYVARDWIRPADGADTELLDHVEKYNVRAHAPFLKDRRVFLAGGIDDQTTPVEDHLLPVYRALQRAEAEQVHIAVYQTDHSFREARDQVADELVEWVHTIE